MAYCDRCGAEVLEDATYCHKCGSPLKAGNPDPVNPWNVQYTDQNKPLNKFALLGFILSFVSPGPSLILSIVGLVLIKKHGHRGKAFAIAGIVISVINMILKLILLNYMVGGILDGNLGDFGDLGNLGGGGGPGYYGA